MPLPDGREWGSTAGVDAAKGRDDIWAIDRCGSNTCVGSSVDPILHYDADGNLIGRMGAGLFAFPHGIHVDREGNVWVTDPLPPDGRGAGGSVGQQVTKLNPTARFSCISGLARCRGTARTSSAPRLTSWSQVMETSSSPTAMDRARTSAS